MADTAASPLKGKRVVVTRAVEQTSDLLARLTSCGAIPISLPLVSFAPPEDYVPLDAALDQLASFDWIIFTSANAVHAITTRADSRNLVILRASDKDVRRTSTQTPLLKVSLFPAEFSKIAVVGPATESAAANAGFPVNYVAKTHLGVALAEELGDRVRGKAVFLPRSDRANPDLPAALRALGAKLTEVIAYRTIPPAAVDCSRALETLDNGADAILFFSPSAVHNFADLAGRGRLAAAQEKIAMAAVGPITTRALTTVGVHRIITAANTTSASVVEALASHFAAAPQSSNPSPISATGAKSR